MYTSEIQAESSQYYEVSALADGFSYTLDFPERSEGNAVGTSPTTLLLVALAGCQLMTARSYLMSQNIAQDTLAVKVSGTFDRQDGEWQVATTVDLHIVADLSERQKAELPRFLKKNCRVASILATGNNTVALHIEVQKPAIGE